MHRWQGMTAVVTGAGSGIGAAVTAALERAGLRVVGLERSADLVSESNSKMKNTKGTAFLRQCDISKPSELAAEFSWIEEHCGGIHVLVNNAGVLFQGQITDVGSQPLSEDQLLASYDINVKGAVMCTRHAVASMVRNNFDGHVVNINSLAGHYIPFSPAMNVYASTKHAMCAFTSSLTNEMAHFNTRIKTTSVSPGYTRTGMAADVDVPMLQPADVADAVLYALSTPPHVNITELTIQPVLEKRL